MADTRLENMQNSAGTEDFVHLPDVPFMNSKVNLNLYYDLDLNEDDFIEYAWHIYKEIGNIAKAKHLFIGKPDSELIIQLPCNVEYIDIVSTDEVVRSIASQAQIVEPLHTAYFSATPYALELIDSSRFKSVAMDPSISRPVGQRMNYELLPGNRLKLRDPIMQDKAVYILYLGILLDEDGLPSLFLKESLAIAARVAFILTQKQVFKKVPGSGEILEYIKRESGRLMQACKSPEYLSQSDLDKLLNRTTTFDRKTYGRTFKADR
jgi:hypothetical protein